MGGARVGDWRRSQSWQTWERSPFCNQFHNHAWRTHHFFIIWRQCAKVKIKHFPPGRSNFSRRRSYFQFSPEKCWISKSNSVSECFGIISCLKTDPSHILALFSQRGLTTVPRDQILNLIPKVNFTLQCVLKMRGTSRLELVNNVKLHERIYILVDNGDCLWLAQNKQCKNSLHEAPETPEHGPTLRDQLHSARLLQIRPETPPTTASLRPGPPRRPKLRSLPFITRQRSRASQESDAGVCGLRSTAEEHETMRDFARDAGRYEQLPRLHDLWPGGWSSLEGGTAGVTLNITRAILSISTGCWRRTGSSATRSRCSIPTDCRHFEVCSYIFHSYLSHNIWVSIGLGVLWGKCLLITQLISQSQLPFNAWVMVWLIGHGADKKRRFKNNGERIKK